MKNNRTGLLLFAIAFVASVAFAQAKRLRPVRGQAAPPPPPVTGRAVAVEAAPAQQRTVSGMSSTTSDTSSTVSDTASDAGDASLTVTDSSSTAGNVASTAETRDWRFLTTIIVAAVVFLLAAVALALQMKKVTRTILAALPRGDEGRHDRERVLNELAVMKNDTREQIALLRTTVEAIPAKVQQLAQKLPVESKPPASAPSSQRYETREPPRPIEDASAQLLTIANQLVQQTPTTLDAFRASTRQLSVRVSPWPNAADGAPVAFIVEHRDSYYAIPNVIKPARLPQEWFNRAEFGVNDEIQRVVELPRLRRRGNGYEVAVPGVFAR